LEGVTGKWRNLHNERFCQMLLGSLYKKIEMYWTYDKNSREVICVCVCVCVYACMHTVLIVKPERRSSWKDNIKIDLK
jgi:hypothetical protein